MYAAAEKMHAAVSCVTPLDSLKNSRQINHSVRNII